MTTGSEYVLIRTVFTPADFSARNFTEMGRLSLRSRSSSTTSTGNSAWVSRSGQVVTAATMLMSLAAPRIHSVRAPSSIRWSSTIASRMWSCDDAMIDPSQFAHYEFAHDDCAHDI